MDNLTIWLGGLAWLFIWVNIGIGPLGALFDYLYRLIFKIHPRYKWGTYLISGLLPGIGPVISFLILAIDKTKGKC